MEPLRIGVIGYGYWGPNLTRNFFEIPSSEVIAIADKRKEQLERAELKYPRVTLTENYKDLFSLDLDAVVISTPPASHFAIATECMENGLNVPPLSPRTRQKLSELLGEVGSILHNPVDVSQAQFRGLETLFQSIDLVARDTAIDVILIQEDIDILLPIYARQGPEEINDFFIELADRQNKPIIVVLPHGSAESERMQIEQKLLAASIPVLCSMERAAKAICNINQYSCWQEAK